MFRYLLPLFVLLSFLSCVHSGSRKLLMQAEELMIVRPDSALALLNGMDRSLLKSPKEQALYALLMSEALDKNYIDLTTDSVIRPAVEYYSRRGNKKHRAKMYLYYGRICLYAGNMDAAVKNFMYALQYVPEKEYHLKGMVLSTLGYLYNRQENYQEALNLFGQATEAYRKDADKKRLCYTLGCEGNILLLLLDYEGSVEKSKEALGIAKELNDTASILTLSTYISMYYLYCLNDIPQAKELLLTTYSTYLSGSVPAKDYALWGMISLSEGDFKTAERYFSEATGIKDDPRRYMAFMAFKSALHEEREEYKESLEYLKEWKVLRDSLDRAEKEVLLHSLERKYQTQLLQESNDLLKRRRTYLYIIIGLIILLTISILYIIAKKVHRNKKKKERELEEYRGFIRKIKEERTNIQEELDSVHRLMSKNSNAYQETFAEKINSIKEFINELSDCGNNQELLVRKIKKYICIEESKKPKLLPNVQETANMVYSGIMTAISKRYPDLHDDDLNLIALMYLGFTTNSIQLFYNYINIRSLYNRQSRIKRKMNVEEQIGLETFLKNFQDEYLNLL